MEGEVGLRSPSAGINEQGKDRLGSGSSTFSFFPLMLGQQGTGVSSYLRVGFESG